MIVAHIMTGLWEKTSNYVLALNRTIKDWAMAAPGDRRMDPTRRLEHGVDSNGHLYEEYTGIDPEIIDPDIAFIADGLVIECKESSLARNAKKKSDHV